MARGQDGGEAVSVVLGLDVGLAALGWAVVDLSADGERVVDLGTVTTAKSSKRRGVRVADDDVRRCRELAAFLLGVIDRHDVVAIAAELPHGSKGARAAAALGMAKAILASVAEARGLPIAACSPVELKQATAGSGSASKADVQAALVARFGPLEWPKRKADVEHAADALGAVVACLDSDVLRMARRVAA